MQVVLITDEVGGDVADAVAFARAHGVAAVSIRAVGGQPILDLDETALDDLARTVERLAVPVSGLLSPLFKAYPPGQAGPPLDDPHIPPFSVDATVHLAQRDRLPALAERLGAGHVRVFSFLRHAGARDEPLPPAARDLLADLAASRPGLYALENEDVCFAATVGELTACVEQTGLRAILDPGNDWYRTRRDVAPRLTPGLAAALADVHVKDLAPDGSAVAVGDGRVDWRAIVDRLRELGYDGTLTLEPHLRPDRDAVARSVEAVLRLAA